MRALFWSTAALLGWAQAGYGLALAVAVRLTGRRPNPAPDAPPGGAPPVVSLIVAAHDEEAVIEGKVADALAQRWPRERLEVVVACDGCTDATAERARAAGADLVLELPRGGKVAAQDAGVERSRGEIVAFSDANARWEPDALERLVAPFADRTVGLACGRVTFVNDRGSNQEGLYWRYEMWLRAMESALSSVTAGNGAIYAVRREAYLRVDPIMGHDLSLPFNLVKRGWRAVEAPEARATEKMVPSVEGEVSRKRRMMSHTWPIVLRGGLLDPRGYPPPYAAMILSHRLLRYLTPFLHLATLLSSAALARRGPAYRAALGAQLALLGAAALAGPLPRRPLLIARYYVGTTAALGLGLLDWLRHGTEAAWEAAEGTR